MLTHVETERIVKDCIRRVRGFGGGVDSSLKLKQVGIQTPDLAKLLRNTIATDQNIGVPSVRNHSIALTALNVTTGTKVLQLQNTVLFNAKAPNEKDAPIANMSITITQPAGSQDGDVIALAEIKSSVADDAGKPGEKDGGK
jgi:hypothetical protein